jgi:hypothetical protein
LEAPPPPHPHHPPVQAFDSIYPAGDVTGDGYDDLLSDALHSNGAVSHGLVSGKTLQTKWQHYDGALGVVCANLHGSEWRTCRFERRSCAWLRSWLRSVLTRA